MAEGSRIERYLLNQNIDIISPLLINYDLAIVRRIHFKYIELHQNAMYFNIMSLNLVIFFY